MFRAPQTVCELTSKIRIKKSILGEFDGRTQLSPLDYVVQTCLNGVEDGAFFGHDQLGRLGVASDDVGEQVASRALAAHGHRIARKDAILEWAPNAVNWNRDGTLL
jgi:hypothetical protein